MKKTIITILFSLILISLYTIPADAYQKGWNVYSNEVPKTWYYVFDDGTMAQGWQFIDGDWYYFAPQDDGGVTLVGGAYISRFGNWKHLWDSKFVIDGRIYFFSYEGKLIRDANVNLDGVDFYIDENGHPQL